MQQHPPAVNRRVPEGPNTHPTADRVPGDPHPLAGRGHDPAWAKRQSLLFSILALATIWVFPLPFVFGAWAIVRASDAGKTGRPALGHVLGAFAIVLAGVNLLICLYLIPAFIRFMFTMEEFNIWLWWM